MYSVGLPVAIIRCVIFRSFYIAFVVFNDFIKMFESRAVLRPNFRFRQRKFPAAKVSYMELLHLGAKIQKFSTLTL